MDETALFNLSYGLYIVTAAEGGRGAGCVVNTVTQVTNTPNRMMVAVNKENFTAGVIQRTGRFCVSVLTEDAPMEMIGLFGFRSGRDVDKFAEIAAVRLEGVPCPEQHVNARLLCKVEQTVDAGTHWLFVALLEDAEKVGSAPSMTYAYYHKVKKGLTPPKASSYQPARTEPAKTSWRCSVCGYIYEGETLPEGYVCPVCRQPARVFEKI